MTGPRDDIILQARQVNKIYPGTIALNNVDFNIYRGKVNVLIGENGAGKSTLMKILAGVEQATSGSLMLEGKEIAPRSPIEAEDLGIGIIYQELNLFPNLNVSENIFVAHERTRGRMIIDHKSQEEFAAKLMERLEQPIDPRTLVADLRIGQQQIVEIAKALSLNARILIMDEPTSALSNTEVEVLFRVIRELKDQGVSIVYISHKLEELMEIGDYITILRDGNLIAEADIHTVDLHWIVENMVGRDATERYQPAPHDIGETIFEVKNLSLPKPGGKDYILKNISFELRAGEILGLYGLMGSGRTELFECLIGDHEYSVEDILLDGEPIKSSQIQNRIEQGLMLIPEDRQREGLIQTLSVRNNMLLASLKRYMRGFMLSQNKEHDAVEHYVKELSIKLPNMETLISSLSGGNQQKVVVGKALLTRPKVLMMDEPTRGIDVGAKQEIFDIMVQLAQQGLGILFVSTELKEVLAVSDRIIVMSKGQITREFAREEANEQALVHASAVGHGTAKSQETVGV
ncbi:MAG: sugar ABC transporter ATP-binding protein [Anaerolineae bacterium]|nr:sugar ABC transporter ATP-binding protein [Anaerolineae bacterium]